MGFEGLRNAVILRFGEDNGPRHFPRTANFAVYLEVQFKATTMSISRQQQIQFRPH